MTAAVVVAVWLEAVGQMTEESTAERASELYRFSYRHAGQRWTLQIPCFSWADAHARALLLNLTLEGKVYEKETAPSGPFHFLEGIR